MSFEIAGYDNWKLMNPEEDRGHSSEEDYIKCSCCNDYFDENYMDKIDEYIDFEFNLVLENRDHFYVCEDCCNEHLLTDGSIDKYMRIDIAIHLFSFHKFQFKDLAKFFKSEGVEHLADEFEI